MDQLDACANERAAGDYGLYEPAVDLYLAHKRSSPFPIESKPALPALLALLAPPSLHSPSISRPSSVFVATPTVHATTLTAPATTQQPFNPDDIFKAEFGDGELAMRLWVGGLRASVRSYFLNGSTEKLTNSLTYGLTNGVRADFSEGDETVTMIVSVVEAC